MISKAAYLRSILLIDFWLAAFQAYTRSSGVREIEHRNGGGRRLWFVKDCDSGVASKYIYQLVNNNNTLQILLGL